MRNIHVGQLYVCRWGEWGTEIREVCLVLKIEKYFRGTSNPNRYTVLRSNGKLHELHMNGLGELVG